MRRCVDGLKVLCAFSTSSVSVRSEEDVFAAANYHLDSPKVEHGEERKKFNLEKSSPFVLSATRRAASALLVAKQHTCTCTCSHAPLSWLERSCSLLRQFLDLHCLDLLDVSHAIFLQNTRARDRVVNDMRPDTFSAQNRGIVGDITADYPDAFTRFLPQAIRPRNADHHYLLPVQFDTSTLEQFCSLLTFHGVRGRASSTTIINEESIRVALWRAYTERRFSEQQGIPFLTGQDFDNACRYLEIGANRFNLPIPSDSRPLKPTELRGDRAGFTAIVPRLLWQAESPLDFDVCTILGLETLRNDFPGLKDIKLRKVTGEVVHHRRSNKHMEQKYTPHIIESDVYNAYHMLSNLSKDYWYSGPHISSVIQPPDSSTSISAGAVLKPAPAAQYPKSQPNTRDVADAFDVRKQAETGVSISSVPKQTLREVSHVEIDYERAAAESTRTFGTAPSPLATAPSRATVGEDAGMQDVDVSRPLKYKARTSRTSRATPALPVSIRHHASVQQNIDMTDAGTSRSPYNTSRSGQQLCRSSNKTTSASGLRPAQAHAQAANTNATSSHTTAYLNSNSSTTVSRQAVDREITMQEVLDPTFHAAVGSALLASSATVGPSFRVSSFDIDASAVQSHAFHHSAATLAALQPHGQTALRTIPQQNREQEPLQQAGMHASPVAQVPASHGTALTAPVFHHSATTPLVPPRREQTAMQTLLLNNGELQAAQSAGTSVQPVKHGMAPQGASLTAHGSRYASSPALAPPVLNAQTVADQTVDGAEKDTRGLASRGAASSGATYGTSVTSQVHPSHDHFISNGSGVVDVSKAMTSQPTLDVPDLITELCFEQFDRAEFLKEEIRAESNKRHDLEQLLRDAEARVATLTAENGVLKAEKEAGHGRDATPDSTPPADHRLRIAEGRADCAENRADRAEDRADRAEARAQKAEDDLRLSVDRGKVQSSYRFNPFNQAGQRMIDRLGELDSKAADLSRAVAAHFTEFSSSSADLLTGIRFVFVLNKPGDESRGIKIDRFRYVWAKPPRIVSAIKVIGPSEPAISPPADTNAVATPNKQHQHQHQQQLANGQILKDEIGRCIWKFIRVADGHNDDLRFSKYKLGFCTGIHFGYYQKANLTKLDSYCITFKTMPTMEGTESSSLDAMNRMRRKGL